MKKILFITLGVLAITAIAFYFMTGSQETVSIEETPSENDGGTIIEIKETNKEPVEEEFPMDMREGEVRNVIHGMSHQKVRADEKWGFIPLTGERVSRLITVVEKNKEEYQNASIYLDILHRWSNNDFSRVDQDHNAIWELQNGNIGRAKGILSPEEEKEYIEEHFDVE